jgi:hypothetical protein
VLAQVHLADEVNRVGEERKKAQQQLRRLGQVYVDGHIPDDEYGRQKKRLEEKIRSLVVPDADLALEAGRLLEDLPRLWKKAGLTERRCILMTMLDAVYVDTVEEKRIVAIRPKPAFRPLLEIATMREGSGIVMIKESDLATENDNGPEVETTPAAHATAVPCWWWRRGRVELYREHGEAMLDSFVKTPRQSAPSST